LVVYATSTGNLQEIHIDVPSNIFQNFDSNNKEAKVVTIGSGFKGNFCYFGASAALWLMKFLSPSKMTGLHTVEELERTSKFVYQEINFIGIEASKILRLQRIFTQKIFVWQTLTKNA